MPSQPTIVVGRPEAFSKEDRRKFIELVIAGGEVVNAVLDANVNEARCLVFLSLRDQFLGVAALKNPRSTYRARIQRNTGAELGMHDFPYELGYVYLIPSAREKGYSRRLTEAALSECGHHGVFATCRADNERMRASLRRHGFLEAGQAYRGRIQGQFLRLFLRPGAQT